MAIKPALIIPNYKNIPQIQDWDAEMKIKQLAPGCPPPLETSAKKVN